jgi:hypothetical protein
MGQTYLRVDRLVVNLSAEWVTTNGANVGLNDGIREAVLVESFHIFRYCDEERTKREAKSEVQRQRPKSVLNGSRIRSERQLRKQGEVKIQERTLQNFDVQLHGPLLVGAAGGGVATTAIYSTFLKERQQGGALREH